MVYEAGSAFEKLTISNTAVSLTALVYEPAGAAHNELDTAHQAIITVETANIRYRLDGVAPTDPGEAVREADYGLLMRVGDILTLESKTEIRKFRAIRATASDATINVQYRGMGGSVVGSTVLAP